MSGSERRAMLLNILRSSDHAVSGDSLSKQLHVSRQVIVQDIALIRARLESDGNGELISTHRGYILHEKESSACTRIIKVCHTDEAIEEELQCIVDLGGRVEDVFIYHKVYGVIRAELNLRSRRGISDYIKQIQAGTSSPLKNITSGYHYHTITADDKETLMLIQDELWKRGFLAPLRSHEPIDFENQ